MNNKRLEMLGISIDCVNSEEAMVMFKEYFSAPQFTMIVTPNAQIMDYALKNNKYKTILERADIIIPDGIGLIYASRLLGTPISERVTGIDFLEQIIGYLEQEEKSIFFLGSKPGIAELAGEKCLQNHPELKIAGTHHGYFKPHEEADIVQQINDSKADFLCVAMGAPKQEEFIHKHKNELFVSAAIGVGGSLDVMSGTLNRAPAFFINHGLEWLYRIIQEPRRIKGILAIMDFLAKVLLASIKKGRK